MPYCPKCGSKIEEEMVFCPKCGVSLRAQSVQPEVVRHVHYRNEKGEKAEKHEKHEKAEKSEKHEHAFIGPLIGGLILIFIGLAFYLEMTNHPWGPVLGALFFVMIGAVIIILAVYGAMMASRRHPRT